MPSGRVKWFNNAKGYGFILPEGVAKTCSCIILHPDGGYKTLKAGQEVQYDLHRGPKGMHAVNIQAAESSSEDEDGERAERTRRIADEVRKTLKEEFSEPSH